MGVESWQSVNEKYELYSNVRKKADVKTQMPLSPDGVSVPATKNIYKFLLPYLWSLVVNSDALNRHVRSLVCYFTYEPWPQSWWLVFNSKMILSGHNIRKAHHFFQSIQYIETETCPLPLMRKSYIGQQKQLKYSLTTYRDIHFHYYLCLISPRDSF